MGTRVGLATAAARLGLPTVDVAEQRFEGGMSSPESFVDTLRTVSGFVDLLVVRSPVALNPEVVNR